MTDTDLNSLYRIAPVVLWVEDTFTRDYLRKAWGTPADIGFLIAGQGDSISRLVPAAHREGIGHIFGIVDRDFGFTNRDKWANPETTVFYLPRHEMENYLLDPVAFEQAGLNERKRTAAEIQGFMAKAAEQQPAWLACRKALQIMREDLIRDFPSAPSITRIASERDAIEFAQGSLCVGTLGLKAYKWLGSNLVEVTVRSALADYSLALANGGWVERFSGKEVFRQTRAFVYEPPRRGPRRTSSQLDGDMAQAIGTWQERNGFVPADILDLLSILRTRAGLRS